MLSLEKAQDYEECILMAQQKVFEAIAKKAVEEAMTTRDSNK